MTNPSLILPQSPAFGENNVYAARVEDGAVPLYNVLPLDFTRASNGTRVNKDGLIENMPYNLLEQSNTFDNAAWVKTRATFTGGQSGYDGSSNAWAFVDNTNNSTHLLYQFLPALGAEVATMSVYAKAGDVNFIAFRFEGADVDYAYFNLANGTLGTIDSDYIDARITSVGGGWYRCEATRVLAASGNQAIMLPAQSDNDPTYAGAGTAAIYIQDAQVNIGSTAKPYLATTDRLDMPRITYPIGGGCGSLLLEPQRTNLFNYSEQFDNSYWTKSGATITANNTTSPDGYVNADKFTENGATGNHLFYNTLAITASATSTFSVFYKKGTRRYFSIKLQIGSNSYTQVFDSDLLATTSSSSNGLTGVSTSIVAYANGWVRASVSGTDPSGSSACYGIASLSNSDTPTFDPSNYNPTYQGSSSEYGYFWGAQLEAGSYVSSYIPTLGAAVTRVADSCSKTGISDLIGQTEGTMFVEVNGAANTGTTDRVVAIGDGTSNNRIIVLKNATGNIFFFVASGGTTIINQTNISGTSIVNGNFKIAVAYKSGEYAIYLNGVSVFTSTATVVPATGNYYLAVNEEGGVSAFSGKFSQATLYKTRLTNTELANITSL